MSTLKTINVIHPSGSTTNIVNDSSGNVAIGNNLTVAGTSTLTGNVTAAGTVAMGSSFKRNRIINGNMLIDQRNAGAAVTVTAASAGYAADRFRIYHDTAVTGSWTAQQSTQVPTTGYANSLSLTNGTAATPGASDVNIIQQRIEGYNVADLNFGSSTAATVTISFWVRSSVAGTYGFGLTNSAQNRSYVSTYSIASANTWQQVSITIAGDQAGTWLANSGVGLMATWDLGSGSSTNTTAGAWAAGQYFRTSGCVTWINNSSATFYITGVQLEVGTKATPYEMQIYSDQLAQCQRYYEYGASVNSTSSTYSINFFKVTKRVAPTIVLSGYGGSISTGPGSDLQQFNVLINTTTGYQYTATAEL
jgi:hypothetical protein